MNKSVDIKQKMLSKSITKLNLVLPRISTSIVFVYLLIALSVYIFAPILAYRWMEHPYLGVFIDKALHINTTISFVGSDLDSNIDLFKSGGQIISLGGQTITSIGQLNEILSYHSPSDTVQIDIKNSLGNIRQFDLNLKTLSFPQFLTFFIIPYLIGISFLFLGIWFFAFRRRDSTGNIFTVFTISASLSIGLVFDAFTSNQLEFFWLLGLSVLGGAFIALGTEFPENEKTNQTGLRLNRLVFLISGLLFLYSQLDFGNQTIQTQRSLALYFIQIFIILGYTINLINLGIKWQKYPVTRIREQYKRMFLAMLLSFSIPLSWSLILRIQPNLSFSPLLLLSMLIFPVAAISSLSDHPLLQTDYFTRRILTYGSLIFFTGAAYTLIVAGLTLILRVSIDVTNPYTIGFLIIILSIVILPLRDKFKKVIDNFFDQNQELYRLHIQAFSHDLTEATDENGLNHLLRSYLNDIFSPNRIHIFITNPTSDYYYALQDEYGQATSDLLFPTDSDLVKLFAARRTTIHIEELNTAPPAMTSEINRLKLLRAVIFVPLPGRNRLIGWLAIDERSSKKPFNQQDLNFLEMISDQAALAFERSQAFQDLARRIHQMNILNRMTQGINLTNSYDDILELIFTQTNQILPTLDFKISLIDDRTGGLTSIFYLENDERIKELENKPVPLNQGLEYEVIKLSRAITTQDLNRECRSRDLLPPSKEIFAWIGVPLNTGVETIGVLSLGSRNPSVFYSSEQTNLLQAIADQAAGAIVKSGLLEDTERRARQLATLNEVARRMSSTLELVPLFNHILNSVVNLLNCESGSLLLIDEETGEYKFVAAHGPSTDKLIGTKLPPGTGLIGKAVITRKPFFVNDTRRLNIELNKSEQESENEPNDILVVPMLYRDEVSGVIEAKNRTDRLPFTQEDQELLSTFAGQAAVALENARLFTLTDQTLAERVEELSVLQRIDRELNASLNVEKASQVTLDWAIKQTQAEAGLVVMIEDNSTNIVVSQGYLGEEVNNLENKDLILTFPAVHMSFESGFSEIIEIDPSLKGKFLLEGTHQQIAIPLLQESHTIGVVLLESKSQYATKEEIVGFLNRLGDHASIAITNARLYAEVQEANQAKSDFVSFVSHELKTPMTSIRGFTDLLAAGVVGEINENQSNFLNTIRSNVERMATLVSDLTDVSRIEAGRLPLEYGAVNLNEIVDDVVRSTRNQILEKKQTLIMDIPENLPDMWGDRIRLIQILTNLVSNAYKYTPAEGLIKINAQAVENKWTIGAPKVLHIYVQDNGLGISDENQTKIFQKFYRSDDQKVRDSPGTGLGLNITKQLVELQGGAIWFESEFRKGSTFHFIIPIVENA